MQHVPCVDHIAWVYTLQYNMCINAAMYVILPYSRSYIKYVKSSDGEKFHSFCSFMKTTKVLA